MTEHVKNRAAMTLGRRGGRVKSAAKAAAVRENGKRGGRPSKADLEARRRIAGVVEEVREVVKPTVETVTSAHVLKVVVIDHMNRGVRVHAAGCQDLARESKRANTVWQVDVPAGDSVAQVVVEDINAGFDEGEPPAYTVEQITVLPCITHAIRTNPPVSHG
jgi:hypothetical protein